MSNFMQKKPNMKRADSALHRRRRRTSDDSSADKSPESQKQTKLSVWQRQAETSNGDQDMSLNKQCTSSEHHKRSASLQTSAAAPADASNASSSSTSNTSTTNAALSKLTLDTTNDDDNEGVGAAGVAVFTSAVFSGGLSSSSSNRATTAAPETANVRVASPQSVTESTETPARLQATQQPPTASPALLPTQPPLSLSRSTVDLEVTQAPSASRCTPEKVPVSVQPPAPVLLRPSSKHNEQPHQRKKKTTKSAPSKKKQRSKLSPEAQALVDDFFDPDDSFLAKIENAVASSRVTDEQLEANRRTKAARKQMHGYDCICCKAYYDDLGLSPKSKRARIQQVSRHRTVFPVAPSTPEGYWDVHIRTPPPSPARHAQ